MLLAGQPSVIKEAPRIAEMEGLRISPQLGQHHAAAVLRAIHDAALIRGNAILPDYGPLTSNASTQIHDPPEAGLRFPVTSIVSV